MTASKYWGEERHADAVYAVMLKKVRYVPPSDYEGVPPIGQQQLALTDGSAAAMDHLQWETIRERVIKAGTVRRLVESLIDADGQMDSRQFNVFFATYRAFSTAAEVFCLVTDLYTKSDWAPGDDQEEIRRSLRAVLMCWLEMYPEDFYEQKQQQQQQQTPHQSNTSSGGGGTIGQHNANANATNKCASGGVPAPSSPAPLRRFPTLDALVDFARSHALHDLKQKGKRVRERLRRVAQNGGLSAQLPSIGRYSFAITGYDPNQLTKTAKATTTTAGSPLSPSASVSSAPGTVEADERYARALASAQERAQMFDTSTENVPQIAEQLTLWDALFFRELRPYQCQGAIWGRRHKTGNGPVYSVRATIDQFNAVSERVMTSIVLPECRADQRARIVEKWVEVARELRALRNFSALKATISALQSEPVFRLKQCWALVSNVDGGGGGKQKARHILETEGTAKVSPAAAKIGGGGLMNGGAGGEACRRTKSDLNLAVTDGVEQHFYQPQQQQGTVPWLGTFLTDLEKLDQLYPDMTPDGLHNFEKRRKEFEVLAEIRLFQSAARSYTIQLDQAFCVWFHFLPALNEKECFARSIELEPLLVNNNFINNSSSNHNHNNSNSSATSTPEEVAAVRRRGVRDGLNMHSLGRFLTAFSTAGGSSKDLDNGSPQRHLQQQFSADGIGTNSTSALHQQRQSYSGGRRGSVCGASITDNNSFVGVGIDLMDGGSSFCCSIGSTAGGGATPTTGGAFGASFEKKKPPRGGAAAIAGASGGGAGRSQSQGAKKAHRAAASAAASRRSGGAAAANYSAGAASVAPYAGVPRRSNASPSPARSAATGGGSVPPPSTLQHHQHAGANNYCCHHRHRLSQQPPASPSTAASGTHSGSEFAAQQLLMFPSSSSVLSPSPAASSARFVATPPSSAATAASRRLTDVSSQSATATATTTTSSALSAVAGGVEFGRQPCAGSASFSSSSAAADPRHSSAAHFGTASLQHTSSQGSSFNSSASRFATAAPTPPPKCRNSAATSGASMMMSPLTSMGVEQNGGGTVTALRRSHNESTGSSAGGGLRRLQQQQFSQKSISSTSSRSSMGALSSGGSKVFGGASPSSVSMSNGPREEQNFHLIRVGFDDTLQGELINAATINYKCIKVENGDRMPQLIERALDKHLMDPTEAPNYCLVQLLPDGSEFVFPDHCNPFYAVAPDPSSPMLACVLRKRRGIGSGGAADNASLATMLNCSSGSTRSAAAMLAAQQQQNNGTTGGGGGGTSSALAKKLNKQKRNNLLRWSSGFL
ncbi:hypothetical protein niasHT_003361 [Heterodera trifolii]|uniref:Ral guanine nucleotide dissociation stimulator-like 1 n=1 Tax=Heterodera trifolii TaxID=157864 RepID=A0ABD2LNL3_9BILA